MKVIVEHTKKASHHLGRYTRQIETLGINHKLLNIQEKHLPQLSEIVQYIEPNFTIVLHAEEEPVNMAILDNHDIILALIGTKHSGAPIDVYYNMKTHTLEHCFTSKTRHPCKLISCYSKDDKVNAANYIKCIQYLSHTASALHKPIMIYANLHVPDEAYRYRALTYKIINACLATMNGILITKSIKANIYKYYTPSPLAYEFYLDNTIYVAESLNDAVRDILPLLHISKGNISFKDMYKYHRQNAPLYNDVFYGTISPNQEIYVYLNFPVLKEPQYYETLGLKFINLTAGYGMLYAKKSLFDSLSEILKPQVAFPYYMPISSYAPCAKSNTSQPPPYSVIKENLQYKGSGVYIGLIATDNIDYTSQALRTKDGKTRIACIWEQTEANDGKYYFKEDIDKALESSDPGGIIPLPKEDSIGTMILGIAGGKHSVSAYNGIATEAEFIVAKVNTAPDQVQIIYGGMPNKSAAIMPDIIIGCIALVNFAVEQQKPLTLCVPFNSNIDSHDGTLMLYQVLEVLAARNQLTIIVPSGDEADKMHHYGAGGKQETSNTVSIKVEKANQNVVGIICQRFANILTATLYSPEDITAPVINLKTEGIKSLGNTVIYSNGERINFLNGSSMILFRIDNPQMGEWILKSTTETQNLSQIDIWISQQELNSSITLNPSSPFITVGSAANTNNVMSIGGYDEKRMIVLKNSGRGFSWDNRIKPLFVTHADNIIAPCKQGAWISATGTLPAASIMLGVTAALYNKFVNEQVYPLPNTLVMNSMILSVVKQFEVLDYPNQSQGYGIFDIQSLNDLLANPLIL